MTPHAKAPNPSTEEIAEQLLKDMESFEMAGLGSSDDEGIPSGPAGVSIRDDMLQCMPWEEWRGKLRKVINGRIKLCEQRAC